MFYKDGPNTGTAAFLEQYRLAWLCAPDAVINHLQSLCETLKIDPTESRMNEEQRKAVQEIRDKKGGQAIAKAVAAMRTDLFETGGKSTGLTADDFGHYS